MSNSSGKRERQEWQNFTRGAEIWFHQTRMMFVSTMLVFGFSLATGLIASYVGAIVWLKDAEVYYTEKYYEAALKKFMHKDRAMVKIIINNKEQEVSASYAQAASEIFKDNAVWKVYILSIFGLFVCGVTFGAILYYLTKYGDGKMKDDHLRGGKLTDGNSLADLLIKKKDASEFTIAGIPMRKDSESYHTGVAGAQGTGKSVMILDQLDQLRAKGKKVAIYDPTGQFVEAFYREGKDIILNPLDSRSPKWTPWNEIRVSYDYMNLAEGLIPLPNGNNDPFWALAGRQIFEDVCVKLAETGKTSNQNLYKSMALDDLDKIHELLKGTAGASYVSPTVEKTGQSIRMVVVNALKSFCFLHDDGEPFSIRSWLEKDDDDSWLFITSRESQKTALKPLISLWASILIRYSMDLTPIHGRLRHRIVFDELAGLHKLETLELGLTNLRKFGVPLIVGFQQFSQLVEIYGENVAKTIISMLQTKLILRVGDGDTAETLSRLFGKAEIDEKEETYSYGINAQRDGVSVFSRRQMREIVLSSEILYLPDLTGYYSVPGDYPVARVKFGYKSREKVAEGFIERKGFEVSHAQAAMPRPAIPVGALQVDTTTGEILIPIEMYTQEPAGHEDKKPKRAPRKRPKKDEAGHTDDSVVTLAVSPESTQVPGTGNGGDGTQAQEKPDVLGGV